MGMGGTELMGMGGTVLMDLGGTDAIEVMRTMDKAGYKEARKGRSPDLVGAVSNHPGDGTLSLKGDKSKAAVFIAIHLVPWHVHVQHIPEPREVVLHAPPPPQPPTVKRVQNSGTGRRSAVGAGQALSQ